MNRLIFVIVILLSIYYIYKQSKKQHKIIEKLTLRINVLEKNNKLEFKNKQKNQPLNQQLNKSDNQQLNKSDKQQLNKSDNQQLNKSDNQQLNKSDNQQLNTPDANFNLNNISCKIDTMTSDSFNTDSSNINTCKIPSQSNLTNIIEDSSNTNIQQVIDIEQKLHKFYQDTDMEDIHILNESNHPNASIIFDTKIYPGSVQSNNVVEIDSVESMSDSEFSLETTDNTSVDLSNITNVNGLESDTLNDIQAEFDKNFQQLINSDTESDAGSETGLPKITTNHVETNHIKQENQTIVNYTDENKCIVTNTNEKCIVTNTDEKCIVNDTKNNEECVNDTKNNEECVNDTENNEVCVNDTENNEECVNDTDDNEECANDTENNEECANDTDDNEECANDTDDNRCIVNNTDLINEVKYVFTTKKYALQNKDRCCTIKKFGPNIGAIGNKLNVLAQDYLFIEYNDKKLFYDKINNIKTFSKNTILTKQNFGNYLD